MVRGLKVTSIDMSRVRVPWCVVGIDGCVGLHSISKFQATNGKLDSMEKWLRPGVRGELEGEEEGTAGYI